MPARIDHPAVREQVRLLYLANGKDLSAAARTAGIPIDRVEKWKQRGKWDQIQDAITKQISVSEDVRAVTNHAASELESNGKESRLKLSRATKRAAETFADMDGIEVITASRNLKDVVGAASQIHSWEKQEEGSGVFPKLNVYSQQTVIQVKQKE